MYLNQYTKCLRSTSTVGGGFAGTVMPIREWINNLYAIMCAIIKRILAAGNDDSVEAHARSTAPLGHARFSTPGTTIAAVRWMYARCACHAAIFVFGFFVSFSFFGPSFRGRFSCLRHCHCCCANALASTKLRRHYVRCLTFGQRSSR